MPDIHPASERLLSTHIKQCLADQLSVMLAKEPMFAALASKTQRPTVLASLCIKRFCSGSFGSAQDT